MVYVSSGGDQLPFMSSHAFFFLDGWVKINEFISLMGEDE